MAKENKVKVPFLGQFGVRVIVAASILAFVIVGVVTAFPKVNVVGMGLAKLKDSFSKDEVTP